MFPPIQNIDFTDYTSYNITTFQLLASSSTLRLMFTLALLLILVTMNVIKILANV